MRMVDRVSKISRHARRLLSIKTFFLGIAAITSAVLLAVLGVFIGFATPVGPVLLICATALGFLAILMYVELRIARLIERTYWASTRQSGAESASSSPKVEIVERSADPQPKSQYSPGFCSSTTVTASCPDVSGNIIAGREGARVEVDESQDFKMASLLAQVGPEPSLPEIALVGTSVEANSLGKKFLLKQLRPGFSRLEVPQSAGYFVISTRASDEGLWSGVLDSSNFTLFDQLRRAAARAKQNGTLVVVLDYPTRTTTHFTNSICELADVIIDPHSPADLSEAGGGNRVVRHLRELVEMEE